MRPFHSIDSRNDKDIAKPMDWNTEGVWPSISRPADVWSPIPHSARFQSPSCAWCSGRGSCTETKQINVFVSVNMSDRQITAARRFSTNREKPPTPRVSQNRKECKIFPKKVVGKLDLIDSCAMLLLHRSRSYSTLEIGKQTEKVFSVKEGLEKRR